MSKTARWFLGAVGLLCVAAIACVVVFSHRSAASAPASAPAAGSNTPANQTVNNASDAASNPPANTIANTSTPSSPSNDTTNATAPGGATDSESAFTAADAIRIANQIPGIQNLLKTDKNAVAIPQGTHTDSNGMTYISLEYADNMSNHVAALYWIDVRSDGMVRNGMTQSAWTKPDQFTLSN
ncbi:hypothetical protein JI721_08750 [Alicyclobacillus cycloheptanicus]|uniref:Cytoskeletal protein RodZ n=1 Tax=Alicyclobacillus cycloheptanicus TaxID=1457 RepID=A0ABT9XKA0_9BACL|nr:hypothetical protein [Alicyclobacillus cycloheptanicus]MDQ0190735.1 cytoskeletal protein RodZ [Alicyclobacillus cycloheptanicus]WDL99874.1 hypothetical protein JI721_08750 [Alicyclobacillus cycloheptanicus]